MLFRSILRSIPHKLAGVLAMVGSIFVLFFLPWLDTCKVQSAKFRPIYKKLYWLFVVNCIILGIVGAYSPDYVFDYLGGMSNQTLGQITTVLYFAFFLIAVPLLGMFEKTTPLPASISAPVKRRGDRRKKTRQETAA